MCVGNNILFRGVENGRRVKKKLQYAPTLFLPSNKKSEWKSLHGEYLEPMRFGEIREARDFVRRYEEVENFKIYGNSNFQYSFIADQFPGQIDWDIDQLAIDCIDIEVGSENGFPDPYLANEPITAICRIRVGGSTVVYGCGDYNNYDDSVQYIKCRDEYSLCKKFLEDWFYDCPDLLTGWNVKFFDVPYLVNRFIKILGEDQMKRLSPWNNVGERKTVLKGKEQTFYEIGGVSVLDYLELYMWYAPNGKSQENYKLNTVANSEIGEEKISYDEYDNLHSLYRLNHQKFIEYNIRDTQLVLRIDDKLKLIELALTLAYDTKTNYGDVFAQTRMWDALIYNYLLEKKIVVPPKVIKEKSSAFEGAYVKEPQIGKHEWVASFDLNSLYPHLIMQYNVSPETLVEPENYTDAMRKVISSGVSVDKLLDKSVDLDGISGVTITPNNQFFRTDIKGFLPEMLSGMYDDRKKYKKLMLTAEQEYENETDESKKYEIEKRIARYNNLQLAKKVGLNSAYGAMGSQYFRFYDLRMALAVTTAGQLSIRWIEKKINDYMNKILGTDTDYVIASDTDSIYLRLNELVEKVYGAEGIVQLPKQKVIEFMDRVCENKIQPFINKSYQELADYVHAFEQKMQMKREGLSDRGIWTAKKRYILNVYNNEGVAYKEPHLKVMGLEMVKSSTPTIVRKKMKELIKIIVNGTEEEVHSFIADFKQEFKTLPPEEISFPRGVNGLKEYSDSVTLYKKGTPIHVKGAIHYNDQLKKHKLEKKYEFIKEGEKLKFTYLKTPNPIRDSVISYPTRLPKEFGLHEYVDYDLQFSKTFIEPIQVILDCIGWTAEKSSSLEDFFN